MAECNRKKTGLRNAGDEEKASGNVGKNAGDGFKPTGDDGKIAEWWGWGGGGSGCVSGIGGARNGSSHLKLLPH